MNLFPSLPGLAWSVSKTPAFSTRVQKSVSGRTRRLNDQPVPIWNWALSYTVLRDQWDVRAGSGPGVAAAGAAGTALLALDSAGAIDLGTLGAALAGVVDLGTLETVLAGVVDFGPLTGGGSIAGPGGELGSGYDELRSLMGFFLQQQGAYQPFLFDDPTDDSATGQLLGTGDGTTTAWQLVRQMGMQLPSGGFIEPITAPNTVSAVYFDGVVQAASGYAVNPATGVVSFAAAPAAGQSITADFTYWFRVCFADDTAEFENFLYQLWSLKQIKLTSVLN